MASGRSRKTPRTRLNLQPGDRGTKKLVEQYGDRLVCVRYRYDENRKRRLKTVEFIVDEIPWQPKPALFQSDDIVQVAVKITEREVQGRVKRAGGRWNPKEKLWELRYDRAVELGLKRRIIKAPRRTNTS